MNSFQTVTAKLTPVDAARFSGRYETEVVGKDGNPIKVTRSIRKAHLEELLIQGSLTPTKAPALTENAVDDLCDLFETKATVTKSPKVTKKTAEAVDSIKLVRSRKSKTNVVGREKAGASGDNVEGILRKKAPKASSISPIRRSRRLSGCARTRFMGIEE